MLEAVSIFSTGVNLTSREFSASRPLSSDTSRLSRESRPSRDVEPRWYAVRTRARHEKLVRDRLASQDIEQLLPMVKRLSQWKDRKKAIEIPLFSGYCFARFAWKDRLSVQKTFGVANIVGNGQGPEAIPDEEIEAIRILMISTLPYDSHPYLQEGMTVEVTRGPLEGARGILLRKANHCRLIIAVHLIQNAASVEIDAADVTPV